MFLLNPQSKLPLYEQLVEQLRKQIVLGNAAPGSPLPSVRQLSVELGVNPNTIQKAYREMEQEGLIVSLPGRGSFVTSDVATMCTGMAASMAAVLLVAGKEGKRSALKHSRVMIHQPRSEERR